MHDSEKSDSAIVAVKPPNKAGPPVAEVVEPRAGAKGNADQQSTHRTQSRICVTQALNRVRQATNQRFAVKHPRQEPDARIGLVRIRAGGVQQWASLPRSWVRGGKTLGEYMFAESLQIADMSAAW